MLEETSQAYSFLRLCVGKPRPVIPLKNKGSGALTPILGRSPRRDFGKRAETPCPVQHREKKRERPKPVKSHKTLSEQSSPEVCSIPT
jgi:hypothetical protein